MAYPGTPPSAAGTAWLPRPVWARRQPQLPQQSGGQEEGQGELPGPDTLALLGPANARGGGGSPWSCFLVGYRRQLQVGGTDGRAPHGLGCAPAGRTPVTDPRKPLASREASPRLGSSGLRGRRQVMSFRSATRDGGQVRLLPASQTPGGGGGGPGTRGAPRDRRSPRGKVCAKTGFRNSPTTSLAARNPPGTSGHLPPPAQTWAVSGYPGVGRKVGDSGLSRRGAAEARKPDTFPSPGDLSP